MQTWLLLDLLFYIPLAHIHRTQNYDIRWGKHSDMKTRIHRKAVFFFTLSWACWAYVVYQMLTVGIDRMITSGDKYWVLVGLASIISGLIWFDKYSNFTYRVIDKDDML